MCVCLQLGSVPVYKIIEKLLFFLSIDDMSISEIRRWKSIYIPSFQYVWTEDQV